MASDARRFVQDIAKEHGYLGEEVYAKMDADTRRRVEEALLKKDEMIGASVITYELIFPIKPDVRLTEVLLKIGEESVY